MLQDVAACAALAASPSHQAFLAETYRESMSYFFVYSSNRIEHVGTQTYGETTAVLRGAEAAADARALAETRQTKRALDDLLQEHAERSAEARAPNELLYVTASSVLQSHRTLMTGIFAPGAHGYRSGHAQTDTDTGIYYYLAPERVSAALEDLADRMNAIAAAAAEAPLSPAERFAYAAKWLYEFLSIHPFADGNGRCGRLWTAYLLLEILPFPVTILPTLRVPYIRAMENAHLADIQAILVESAWTHMRNFLQAAEAVGGATA
jgi:Fic family protein